MNGSGTFRFHKFTEEEKRPYRYNTNTNFFNSNNFNKSQKKRTFQSRLQNRDLYNNNINYNNIINFQSYQFQTKKSPNIPLLTSKAFQINDNKNNLLNTEGNIAGLQKFPFKKIINIDFENTIKNGDLTQIDSLLPQMLFNNLSFSKNNNLISVLQKYQTLLRFLFSHQEQLINMNSQIEDLFNNEDSDLNKKIKQIEQDEYKSKNLLKINQLQIGKLKDKIRAYKNILISSGHEKLIPNKTLSNRRGKDGLYHCQICPGTHFNTYEQIHSHYIMEHFHLYNDKNILYNTNNVNKMYFDNQLNTFKNELKNELININKQYDDNYNDKKYDDLRTEMNLKDYNKTSGKFSERIKSRNNMSSNNLPIYRNFTLNNNNEINAYLNRLEFEQKCQYDNLTENFNKLKAEIFNEIKNLVIYQPVPAKEIKDNTKIETNIIKNTTTIINEKNNIDINKDINIDNTNENKINENSLNHIDNDKIYKNIGTDKDINDNYTNLKNNIDMNENEKKDNNNMEKKEENENNPQDNKLKMYSHTVDKYTKNIQPIKEESLRNDSTLNNVYNDSSKLTNQENTPTGINQKKSIIGDSIMENPYLKDIKENKSNKSKFGESVNMNNNNNDNLYNDDKNNDNVNYNDNDNLIKNLNKDKFKELYDKREKATLFNKNNDIKEVGDDYKIIDLEKNYTQSVLKLKDDNLENIIKEKQKKYLDNKNERSLGKEEYETMILNIMNDNINKGKNNDIFLKYYNNLIEKNNLNSVLKEIEDDKKQKEMEKQEEEANKPQIQKGNLNYSVGIDFNDILKSSEKKKVKRSHKKSQFDIDELDESENILNKIKKGGGDDYI